MESASEVTTLVTGGTGFLGRPLVDYLLRRDIAVRVVGRHPVTRWRHNPAVEFIRADLSEPGVIERALSGIRTVYHLAAATQGDWEVHQRVTVAGSERLLERLAAGGGGRVLFVSSLGNYDGAAMSDMANIDEDFPLERQGEARASYARAKTESELIAQRYLSHPTVKLTIVRPGLVIGPGMNFPLAGTAVGIKGKLWLVLGTRDKPLPIIDVDDCVRGMVEVAESKAAEGRIYNLVASPMPGSRRYLALYRQLSGDRRPMLRLPIHRMVSLFALADRIERLVRGHDRGLAYKVSRLAKRVYYSAERVKGEVGFASQVALDESLRRMFATLGEA